MEFRLPAFIVCGELVSATHRAQIGKAIWLYLYVQAMSQSGVRWSLASAAAELGLDERTARRQLRRLVRAGYITAPPLPSTTPTPAWLKEHNRLRPLVIARDGYVCGICGLPVPRGDVSIDHIYPRSKGGPTTMANLRVTHRRCNSRKGASV